MPTRLHGLHALWCLALAAPVGALPPCGEPGTISTVTAPDGGDYIAAFTGYKIYPTVEEGFQGVDGPVDLVAAPEYRSHYPWYLAAGPQGRVHISDGTIIYRLEADGNATRLVGVPQYRDIYGTGIGNNRDDRPPRLQEFNVLEDSVAALDARIAPGPMAFDRQGRLYFVDYVDGWQLPSHHSDLSKVVARIARVEPDGRVVTFAGPAAFGYYVDSLAFDLEGHLLLSGHGGIWRIDDQGGVSGPMEPLGRSLQMDDQGRLYFRTSKDQVFRRLADGTIEHLAGSAWDDRRAMRDAALEGRWSEERPGGYYVANGGPATEAPLDYASALALDSDGSLYVANYYFDRIHRVRPDGVIETVAGNGLGWGGSPGCAASEKRVAGGIPIPRCLDNIGDGGPALEAPVWTPFLLQMTPDGDLLVGMSKGGFMWAGGDISHLRRICRVREWMVATAVEAVEEEVQASGAEEALPSVRLYPNPANASVTVAFELDRPASVSVRVYDELGQRVRVLAAEAERPVGSYQFIWDGLDQAGRLQASGTYFLVVSVDGTAESHKLTLLH